jgi:hypothetical protein
MGLQFYKRLKINDNIGVNLSKTGVSASLRSRFGSIGPKGFSVKTGIPGLSLRSSFKNANGKGLANFIIFILILGLIVLILTIIWNLLLVLYWIVVEILHAVERANYKARVKKIIDRNRESENFTFFRFSEISLPTELQNGQAVISKILVENETIVDFDTDIAVIQLNEKSATVSAPKSGKITFCKYPGEKLKLGEYVFLIEHASV